MSRARFTTTRSRHIPWGVLVVVVALSGCSSPEATELPTPDVVWEEGAPTGSVWESEWASAYMEAKIHLAAANAYGDYSDPALIAALGYDSVVAEASIAEDTRFEPDSSQRSFYERDATFAYRSTIVAIKESADGSSAHIQGCATTRQGNDLIGVAEDWTISKVGDGSYRAERNPQGTAQGCGDATLWVGTWAQPIDFENVGRDSVKMPLPREYYVDLGVIPE